jgi:NAD dependent epimerase/dehydratase family enzyme
MPALALRVLVGQFGEILTASNRIVPKAALSSGYQFTYPDLRAALTEVVHGAGAKLELASRR